MQKTLIIISVFILTVFTTSCKTAKDLKSEYKYTADTYLRTNHIRDTVFIEREVFIYDTINMEIETEINTGVEFIDGGGTYNISSGEMTGVKYINTTERERSLESRIMTLSQQLEQSEVHISTLQDSVKMIATYGNEELHTETKMQNFWWVWLVVGIIIGCGVFIALKKIPITAPLMFWL